MAVHNYLDTAPYKPLVVHADTAYRKNSVSFDGTLRRHPYDEAKFLLVTLDIGKGSSFYEFKTEDIRHIEMRPQIVLENGESIEQVRIWMRQSCFGIEMRPFVVGGDQDGGVDTKALYGYDRPSK